MERSAQTIAACLALSAYAIAMVAGVAAQNSLMVVMQRGLMALVVAYALGMVIGMVIDQALREHLKKFEADRPVADLDAIERLAAGPAGEILS